MAKRSIRYFALPKYDRTTRPPLGALLATVSGRYHSSCVFVGTEETLRAAGFVDDETLIPKGVQGQTGGSYCSWRISMSRDRTLRMTIDRAEAARRDRAFQVFLALLLNAEGQHG